MLLGRFGSPAARPKISAIGGPTAMVERENNPPFSSRTPAQQRGRDRRVMALALEHWEEQRQASGLAMPTLDAIVLDHPILKPHFYVVRVPSQVSDSIVIHCGGALSLLCGQDVLGQSLAHCLPREIAAERLDYLSAVAKLGRPMAESGQFDLPQGRTVSFREALMPLLPENGSAIILGALSCRVQGKESAGPRERQAPP